MKVAYVFYPDFTALDLVGPYEFISRWPELDVRFLATSVLMAGQPIGKES